ncbi:hypothetical protein ABBQ32_008763 [Trebouxia sp. C0010 RCD-2024]
MWSVAHKRSRSRLQSRGCSGSHSLTAQQTEFVVTLYWSNRAEKGYMATMQAGGTCCWIMGRFKVKHLMSSFLMSPGLDRCTRNTFLVNDVLGLWPDSYSLSHSSMGSINKHSNSTVSSRTSTSSNLLRGLVRIHENVFLMFNEPQSHMLHIKVRVQISNTRRTVVKGSRRLRNRLKVAQVDAMIRLKLLCPPYEQFQYQAAIDMFDNLKGLDRGLLARLNKEVSSVQASFVADNEEEDVQDFNDADSQCTVSDCVFSEDEEVVDVESGDEQSANNHFAVDHDEAVDLDEALGLS